MPHIYVSDFRACILAIFWLISLEEHFVEFRVLTVDTYVLPSLYMGWGFSVQTLGPENFTTHELSDESCHCCDTWSKCVSKGVRCGLYMCSIYIIWDDLERVTFTFISGAILFEDNFNEAACYVDIIYSASFLIPVCSVQVASSKILKLHKIFHPQETFWVVNALSICTCRTCAVLLRI